MGTPLQAIRFAFLIGATSWLSGCAKSDEPAPPTRTDLLTGSKWKMTGCTQSYSRNGTLVTDDLMPLLLDCEKDDLTLFTATPSKTYLIDQGALVCNPTSNPSDYKGTWAFTADETGLIYDPGAAYGYESQITTLTSKSLVLLYKGKHSTGIGTPAPYTETTTYTAF